MRRIPFVGAVCAGLLLALAQPGTAQERQWRLTPFAGGTIFAGTVDFDNSFTVGGSAMFRQGRYGFEVTGLFTPSEVTSLVAFSETNLGVSGKPDEERLLIAYAGDQDMAFGSASLVMYSGDSWGPDDPPPAREWYGLVGAGLVRFMDAHPARVLNEGDPVEGWDSGATELMFNVGVGIQFSLSSTLSLQLEARDMIFQAQERFDSIVNRLNNVDDPIEKSLHNNIVLRQGVTFVIF